MFALLRDFLIPWYTRGIWVHSTLLGFYFHMILLSVQLYAQIQTKIYLLEVIRNRYESQHAISAGLLLDERCELFPMPYF